MKHTLAWFALASLLLAGCSDDPKPDDSGDDGFNPVAPPPDEGKGLIRGVVVDPTIMPIAGVMVTIDSLDVEQTTDEKGVFIFNDLDPGNYFLRLAKPGFQSQSTGATVEADVAEPPVVKVQLVPDPTTAPRAVPLQFDGHLACTATLVVGAYPVCSLGDGALGNDRNTHLFDLEGTPDFIQGEMQWESTQSAGSALSFNVWTGTSFDPVSEVGTSPLTIRLDKETLESGNGTETPGESIMYEPGEQFAWRVFTDGADGTNLGICPDDMPPVSFSCFGGAGVAIDQGFTIYTTVFYGLVPDDDYRFLEDGRYQVEG